MTPNIRIQKTANGYEVMLDGKLIRIYQGSQDVKLLYNEIKRYHSDLSRQLEQEVYTRNWHERIEKGYAANSFIDALIITITAYFEKKSKSR